MFSLKNLDLSSYYNNDYFFYFSNCRIENLTIDGIDITDLSVVDNWQNSAQKRTFSPFNISGGVNSSNDIVNLNIKNFNFNAPYHRLNLFINNANHSSFYADSIIAFEFQDSINGQNIKKYINEITFNKNIPGYYGQVSPYFLSFTIGKLIFAL